MAGSVTVVPTGAANIASVLAALHRAGLTPEVSEDPALVRSAARVVLPGVGALGPAMKRLAASGVVEALRERFREGRPTLAVCLGLQLLCRRSEESPDVPALGVIEAEVTRFSGPVRVPQLGWNQVRPAAECRLVKRGYAYFANSYRLTEAPEGWAAAWSEYDGPFVAALERGSALACQFHPELSGRWGQELVRRWADAGGGAPC